MTMLRKITIIFSLILTLTFTPALQNVASARVGLNDVEMPLKIDLTSSTLTVSGAQGKVLHIYNLIGVEIMAVKIDSNLKSLDLSVLSRGIYLVKVGNVSKKINIQR
jgi:hypothetical protein